MSTPVGLIIIIIVLIAAAIFEAYPFWKVAYEWKGDSWKTTLKWIVAFTLSDILLGVWGYFVTKLPTPRIIGAVIIIDVLALLICAAIHLANLHPVIPDEAEEDPGEPTPKNQT